MWLMWVLNTVKCTYVFYWIIKIHALTSFKPISSITDDITPQPETQANNISNITVAEMRTNSVFFTKYVWWICFGTEMNLIEFNCKPAQFYLFDLLEEVVPFSKKLSPTGLSTLPLKKWRSSWRIFKNNMHELPKYIWKYKTEDSTWNNNAENMLFLEWLQTTYKRLVCICNSL